MFLKEYNRNVHKNVILLEYNNGVSVIKRYLKSEQHARQMFVRNVFNEEYNVSVLKKCSQVYNNIHVDKAGVRPKYFLMYI